MFVDLVGSTELASHLDPEDLGLLIRAYQNCCAEVVKRWDGHVAKYMGDGVLAYFGWPQTHEDDPERAVRAGLDLAAHVGKRYFRVEDSDDQDRTAAKIAGKLNALAAMTSARTALHALLRLQIEDAEWQELNPPQRRRRILDAVKALLLLESKREPFVLVIEDLHWADGETVALLDSLIDSLPTHRMLVLVNYRPEFQHAWGGRDLLSAASDQSSRHRRC
jgi:AAA ATPase domain/Adenylate and Guanylate cyclase catalytic domain